MDVRVIAIYESDRATTRTFLIISPSTLISLLLCRDGHIDILATSSGDNTVRYFESDGGAVPAFVTRTISTSATGALSLYVGDYDRDGDLDVLVAATSGGCSALCVCTSRHMCLQSLLDYCG